MRYRPEIDGLRAVAVLPVILFHAGFSIFSGGFVGVDVFFVISGYLISSLIMGDLEEGRFSILHFYERRARRILPALFTVLAACLPVAWILLPHDEMRNFGAALIAVVTFTANFLFWMQINYFAPQAELNPLLHTWSLAVEEQYYVIAPLAMALIWRFRRGWMLPAFVVCCVASLAIGQYAAIAYPNTAYYFPVTRFWEIMLGAIAAMLLRRRSEVPSNDMLALAGLAGIVASVFLYDSDTPFPGLYALLPTVGTCLIIGFSGPGTIAHRILSQRLVVGLGLISYSAYLWHQPVLAFARHIALDEPSTAARLTLCAATLALAWLSWRFVEAPFRARDRVGRRAIFAGAAAGILAAGLCGAVILTTSLSANRLTRSGLTYGDLTVRLAGNLGLNPRCDAFTTSPACRHGDKPIAAVWGDSYAAHLVQALTSSSTPFPFVQMTHHECGPFLGLARNTRTLNAAWGKTCILNNDRVFDWLKTQPDVQYVILSSTFLQFEPQTRLTLRDGSVMPAGDGLALTAFKDTLTALKAIGKTPVIVTPPPTTGRDSAHCILVQEILGGDWSTCDFALSKNRVAPKADILAQIAQSTGTPLIDLAKFICPEGACASHDGGTIIYRDAGHLSYEGSAWLGRKFDMAGQIVN